MVFVSLLQGIVAGIGFYLFGMSTPVLWGFLTFIIAMLPFVSTNNYLAAIGYLSVCLRKNRAGNRAFNILPFVCNHTA